MHEPVDRVGAQRANSINSVLQTHTLFTHDHLDHVMGITFGLFDIVRKDVLKKSTRCHRSQ